MRSDAKLPVIPDCERCGQALQEWESGVCEGCGLQKWRLAMDKKTANVLYMICEYLSESGRWFDMCRSLDEKGITPKEIADAVNLVAKQSGSSTVLQENDCV